MIDMRFKELKSSKVYMVLSLQLHERYILNIRYEVNIPLKLLFMSSLINICINNTFLLRSILKFVHSLLPKETEVFANYSISNYTLLLIAKYTQHSRNTIESYFL